MTQKKDLPPAVRARLLVRSASLVTSFYALWVFSGTLRSGSADRYSLPFVIALVATAVTCAAAWRYEANASLALIGCALLLGLTAAYSLAGPALAQGQPPPSYALVGLLWALPFVIFGLLFRAVARASARP